jgi:outer membrane protein insertion porin family
MRSPLLRFFRAVVVAGGLVVGASGAAQAFAPFTIDKIEVEGLQRITDGTVLNYLPINSGDQITPANAQASIRALYNTDFFSDVSLARDGSTLIVTVVERPTVSEIDVEGAKKLGGDELKKNLAAAGLEEGRMFRRSLMDQISQEIRGQYYSNGRYGVTIVPTVEDQPGNRVKVLLEIDEGKVTTIQKINIIGNTLFSDDELLENFQQRESGWGTLIGSGDQYSQQKLGGDLEILNSYYQNRGYIEFGIEGVQVSVSPDKRDMYLTVNITEGEQYKVGEVSFVGELILEESKLRDLVLNREGAVFNREFVRVGSKLMVDALSNQGYAFADVIPRPQLNKEEKTVDMVYQVVPKTRVYVRRIEFTGNEKTNDYVFRREMRLLEGDWFSQQSLQRSESRLRRQPYVEDLSVETVPVPGIDDMIDIVVQVTERAPGSVQFGVGFSEGQGFLINGNVTHSNFMGTGSRVSAAVNRTETTDSVNFSHTNPYFTDDGIGRTLSAFYRRSDALATTISSNFSTDAVGASIGFTFPLSENNSWNIGFGYRNTAMKLFTISSDEVNEFVFDHGSNFDTISINAGWSRDTRNRGIFATRGTRQSVGFNLATPLGDLEYYRASYNVLSHISLPGPFTLALDGNLAYADSYGDTSAIPPFERYFTGGPDSVRGFRASSLGPLDSNGSTFGGAIRTVARAELILPTPFKNNNRSTRLVLFADAGNVFNDIDEISQENYRASAGAAFYWLTPILGMLKFSYAKPFNDQPGDRLDQFQFTFGTGF